MDTPTDSEIEGAHLAITIAEEHVRRAAPACPVTIHDAARKWPEMPWHATSAADRLRARAIIDFCNAHSIGLRVTLATRWGPVTLAYNDNW